MRVLFIALAFAAACWAFSGTIPPSCTVEDNWGCNIWWNTATMNHSDVHDDPDTNRLNCTDPTKGTMPWVTKPVFAPDYYTLRTSESSDMSSDPDNYVPGEYMYIYLQTKDMSQKFRGLSMYASDVSGNRVGEWAILHEDKYFLATDEPVGSCHKTVLHSSAAIKPYLNIFRFKAPAVGTGEIRFFALVKQGPANDGYFYYPNSELDASSPYSLVLSEGQIVEDTRDYVWTKSLVGQNCNDACAAMNDNSKTYSCLESETESLLNSAEAYEEELLSTQTCALPIMSGCMDVMPSTGSEDYCYYKDPACDASRNSDPSDCASSNNDPTTGERFCACEGMDVIITEQTSGSSVGETSSEPLPASSGASSAAATMGVMLLGVAFSVKSRSTGVLFALFALAAFSTSASAHNWLNTRARAATIASLVVPCSSKRSANPHVQISTLGGADQSQEFQMEWATGHDRHTYFILLRKEDAELMNEHTFALLDAYLDDGTAAGKDVSADPLYQKYHRLWRPKEENAAKYQAQIMETDPNYLLRPDNFTNRGTGQGELWSFPADQRVDDRVVVGHYWDGAPWIMGAWKYEHTADEPGESDCARFWLPQDAGEGEFILHYIWSGYRDCVDISVLDQTEPVQHPYGYADGNPTYETRRIDHCYFPDPERYIGPPMEVVQGSIKHCVDHCLRTPGCNAFQVSPMVPPEPVPIEFRHPENNIFFQYANNSLYPPETNRFRIMEYVEDDQYWEEPAKEELRQKLLANPEKLYCQLVQTRNPTSTQDKLLITDDPRDPTFYSTCFESILQIDFIGYNITVQELKPGPFKFLDKCLDCENRDLNWQVDAPSWKFADKCVNCVNEPATATLPVYNHEPLITAMNTKRCIVGNQDQFQNEGEFRPPFLINNTAVPMDESCFIKLGGIGWGYKDDAETLSICAELARNEPNCQDGGVWMYTRTDTFRRDYTGCSCWKKEPASCQTCIHMSQGGSTMFFLEEKPADATCSGGVLSADGRYCCEAGCTECDDGTARNAQIQEFCATRYIPEERDCTLVGPPCRIPQA